MAEKSIIGIDYVKMGACGADGTMGATLTDMGLLVKDSVLLRFDEMGKTDIFIEGSDSPYLSVPDGQRVRQVEWQSRDVDPNTLSTLFGGSVNLDKWSAPTSESLLEQSIEIKSKSSGGYYYKVQIPRALVRASLDGKFVNNDTAIVKVVADVLIPLDASGNPLSPITIEKIAG